MHHRGPKSKQCRDHSCFHVIPSLEVIRFVKGPFPKIILFHLGCQNQWFGLDLSRFVLALAGHKAQKASEMCQFGMF